MSVAVAEVVACARSWLGTRFHHQGRLKKTERHKGGVDCLGLLVGVAGELGLRDRNGRAFIEADSRDYCHLPDVVKLKTTLLTVLDDVAVAAMQRGDVLLMTIDGRAQHLGIVSNYGCDLGIIHAYAPARAVVEHALDAWWRERIVAVFRAIQH